MQENGHEISTFDNMGGSGWASMFHYKTAVRHPPPEKERSLL